MYLSIGFIPPLLQDFFENDCDRFPKTFLCPLSGNKGKKPFNGFVFLMFQVSPLIISPEAISVLEQVLQKAGITGKIRCISYFIVNYH